MRVQVISWRELSVVVSVSAFVGLAALPIRAEDLGYGEGLADALMAAENEETAPGQPPAGSVKVQTIAGSPEEEAAAAGERLPVASQRTAADRQAE